MLLLDSNKTSHFQFHDPNANNEPPPPTSPRENIWLALHAGANLNHLDRCCSPTRYLHDKCMMDDVSSRRRIIEKRTGTAQNARGTSPLNHHHMFPHLQHSNVDCGCWLSSLIIVVDRRCYCRRCYCRRWL